MRSAFVAGALLAVLGCSSSGPTLPQPATTDASTSSTSSTRARTPASIRSLELREEGEVASLELTADRPLVWTTFRDAAGDLVIELPNSVPAATIGDLERASGLIASVDIELHDETDRPLTRLVVHTREASEHSLKGDGDVLRLDLLPVAGGQGVALAWEPLPQDEPEVAAADPVAPTPPVAPPEMAPVEDVPAERVAEEPTYAAAPSAGMGTPEEPVHGPMPSGVVASELHGVEIIGRGDETVVRIAGDGEFVYSTFVLENPERFVIDLAGVVNTSSAATIPVGDGQVEQVRVGQFKPRPDPVSRVVFDLQGNAQPRIEPTGDGLRVFFPGIGEPAVVVASAPPPIVAAPPPPPPPPVAEPAETEIVTATVVAEEPPVEEPTAVAEIPAPPVAPPTEPEPEPVDVAEVEPPVPVYQPPPISAPPPLPPQAPPPTPAAPLTGDVAMFEAQQVQVTPPEAQQEPILAQFETLVVNRRERQYYGDPITMSLRNADLVETLRSFATISGLNFVIQPGVSGSVTVELRGVPWDQAMEQILKINNLGMDINGTVVRIAPLGQLRNEAEEERRLEQAKAQAVPLRTVIKHLSYSSANEMAALLRNRRGSILSQRGTVLVDDRTNALIIRELPGSVDTVIGVIEHLDTPEPQVTIEARIIESTKQFGRSLGIEWGYDYEASQRLGNTTGLEFPNSIDSDGGTALLTGGANGFLNLTLGNILDTFNLDARIQAAENEGLVNVVSAPRVTTLNNSAASIQSGLQIPVQVVSNRTVSVQFVNATLQLTVTPQVTAEGTVMMDITVAKREPQLAFAVVGATNAPIATKEARTKVIVRDGGTAVIGGIYEVTSNQAQDRVPGLANIPILGHLFKNRNRDDSNDELMIFITPRIVQM